ncbi:MULTISPECIES: 3D domain-containing protein [unclassified Paenibacillus]|uniref:3D domain-containing protein n=1 Tax=unclassified Paenibacillus TaxID=185978 RepID=UPI001048D097|nr:MULTISPECIES: 3D domain-containing protein [unclassified Paenibacillus]NIK70233.1 3D (Asp-Asp-Asp) domain-containing protein [Paenibacillus sp. BK720]TCM98060.1 3D (Asp-Asp-Asp) domain-containing protein [Paenibacillus sp. BK033]
MKKASMMTTAVLGLSLIFATGSVHAASKTHTAVEGDTFWKLSQKYSVSVDKLMKANAKINPLNIYAGLKIVIPTTTAKAAATAKTTSTAKAATAKAAKVTAQSVTDQAGTIHTFSKQLSIQATAYSGDASENGGWAGLDYFGNKLKVGTVAVDPKVIPLGTKLYITGYNSDGLPTGGMIATASDVGGAIKGNRIDIYLPGTPAEVSHFGIQDVKVFILK